MSGFDVLRIEDSVLIVFAPVMDVDFESGL